jgi:predicted nucleotidyltransferase
MIRYKPLPADIESRLTEAAKYLEAHPKVIFAYIFGGMARGLRRPLSDVDIAVYLTGTRNVARTKLDILGKLMDILNTEEIDLVVLNREENVPLAAGILQTRKVIVDKAPYERHKFESLAWRKYFDFSPRELFILKHKLVGNG